MSKVPSSPEGEERPGMRTRTDGGAAAVAAAVHASSEDSSGSTVSTNNEPPHLRRSYTLDIPSYQDKVRQPRASNLSQDRPTPSSSQSDRWDMHIEDLKKFKAEHGHCNVPKAFQNNKPLAVFVRRIRLEHADRKLGKSRVKTLIDMGFKFDPLGDQWQSKYNELAKFLEEKRKPGEKEPTCTVTKKENKSLYRWIGKQREEFAKLIGNQKSSMTAERIDLFREINVNLSPTCKSIDGSGSAGAASASEKRGRKKEAATDQENSINVDRPAIDIDHPKGQVHLQQQLQRKEAVTDEASTNVNRPAIYDDGDDKDDLQNRGTCEEIDPVLVKRMTTLSVALNGEIVTGGGKSWADLTKEAHERVEALRKLGLHLSNPDLREECITRRLFKDGEKCIDPVYISRANALSAALGCDGNDTDDSAAVSAEEASEREEVVAKFFRSLSNPPLLEERIERSPPREGEGFIHPDVLEKQRHLSRLIEEGDKAKVKAWISKNEEKQKNTWEEEDMSARSNAKVPANLPENERQAPFAEEASGKHLTWTRQPWCHPDDDGTPVPTSTYIQRANDLTAGLYRYQKKLERGGRPAKQEVDKFVRMETLAQKEGRTLKRQKIINAEAVPGREPNQYFHYGTDDEFENETDEERNIREAREERAVRRFFYLSANYDTIVKKSIIWRLPEEGELCIDPAILGKMDLMNGFLFERDGMCLMNEWYQGTADKEGRPTMSPESLKQQRRFDQALVDSLRKWRVHFGIDFCSLDQAGLAQEMGASTMEETTHQKLPANNNRQDQKESTENIVE